MPTAAWHDSGHYHWRQLGARLRMWAAPMTGRADLTVAIQPAGIPQPPAGVFAHDTGQTTLDANQVLPGCPDPAAIDLRLGRDRALFPVLAGVLAHETGHAEHTRRRPTVDDAIDEWAALLEEPRMEGRVVSRFPEARWWLQAAIAHILGTPDPANSVTAARILVLLGGRALAGVIDPDDLPDLDELVAQYLSPRQVAIIGLETARAVAAADGDFATLLSAARRIATAVASSGASAMGGDDGSAHRHGGSADLDPEGVIGRALRAIATGSAQRLRAAAGVTMPSPHQEARARAARALADRAAAEHLHAAEREAPTSLRRPTAQEFTAQRTLEARLRTAQTRASVDARVESSTPPGRLRPQQLVQRAAQIRNSARPTATPWTRTLRRTVDNPPLTLGIALDVSDSMEPFARSTAAAQWMFGRAVRQLGGRAVTAAWNHDVALLPEAQRGAIEVPDVGGGSSALPVALRVLARELQLERARGARVITVVTDGDLGNADEIAAEVKALVEAGVQVLWLATEEEEYSIAPPPGTIYRLLADPGAVAHVIGDAVVAALAR